MADLITRLLLHTREFDSSLASSTREVQQFQQRIQNFSSGAVSAFTKFAGVLGIAYGATELLQKGLNSNATLQDKYNSLMKTGGTVTDQFFSAIYSGDWSIFNDGIEKAIKNAREYVDEYRKLEKTLRVNSIRYEQQDAKKNQLEAIIEDDSKSPTERRKAQQELDTLLIKGIADIREMTDTAINSLDKMIKATVGSSKYLNTGNAQKLVLDVYDENSEARKELERYRTARDATKSGQSLYHWAGKGTYSDWSKQVDLYDTYSKEARTKNDELLRLADALNEEMFNSFTELFDKMNDLNDKAGTWEKDRTGARDEIAGIKTAGIKTGGAGKVDKKAVEGSIAELDKQLTEWKNKFDSAATYEARVAAEKMIKEITSNKVHLEVEVKFGKADELKELVNNKAIGKLPVEGKNVKEDIKSGALNIKPIKSSVIDSNYEYADSLNAIASVMGSVTNLTNEGAAAWISWGANILTAIAAAIPAIVTLTAAKKTEATANSEAAVTGGMSSVASIPVVGWIMALAAGASIIAAMASIPKFASGGIITGNSFVGDNMIARVNSGEMILNNRQQKNLFSLLDGKGGNSSLNGNNPVEFKIAGKDLVGVLNSQISKTSKYK